MRRRYGHGMRSRFAVVLVALVWTGLHFLWYQHDVISDVQIYKHYGNAMVHHHRVPYRDFRIEYPPAALPVFLIPALTGSFQAVFEVLMALCHLVIVLAVLRLRGRTAAVLAALVQRVADRGEGVGAVQGRGGRR